MIIQALSRYYEELFQQGKVSCPGWDSDFKVAFGLEIDCSGKILELIDLRQEQVVSGKRIKTARRMMVPSHPSRSSEIAPGFLCDNSLFFLGIDEKGRNKRAQACFAGARALHEILLAGIEEPAAQAVMMFFRNWNPEKAREHPMLIPHWDLIQKGCNFLFYYQGEPVTQIRTIQMAWQRAFESASADEEVGQCLACGKIEPIARLHPKIKGIHNGQSAGAALISFIHKSACSYGKERCFNAPVGASSAFSYTTALNSLLLDRVHNLIMGDLTIVCWAECGEECYQNAFLEALAGENRETAMPIWQEDLRGTERHKAGKEDLLDCQEPFFVLGLAPNAGRVAVRFFVSEKFGDIMKNISRHHHDLAIGSVWMPEGKHISIQRIMEETIRDPNDASDLAVQMCCDLLQAVLAGCPYSVHLRNAVQAHILSQCEVNPVQAGILKAYYLRSNQPILDSSVPYILGRLFSLYEQLDRRLHYGKNTGFGKKYFSAAVIMPKKIFPILNIRGENDLRFLSKISATETEYFESQIAHMVDLVGNSVPCNLDISQQGAFQLGYYHQNQMGHDIGNERGHR